MMINRLFSDLNDDNLDLHFIRDFVGLASALTAVAAAFYDEHHQPKRDVTYRPDLAAFNALDWKPVSDQINAYVRVEGLGDWLQSHDVSKIAHYAAGGSATISALELKDGRIKILRTGHGVLQRKFDPTSHTRLRVPQVLQAETSIDSLIAASSCDQSNSINEILPAVPVLPNDIAGIQSVPGHSVYDPTPLHEHILSKDRWARLEGQKLTFCAFLRSQGFGLERVADIGVFPDGTPIFVDPDTLTQGSRRPEVAGARVHNLIGQFGSALDALPCFQWVDGVAGSMDIMEKTKQKMFFPNPYTNKPAPNQASHASLKLGV